MKRQHVSPFISSQSAAVITIAIGITIGLTFLASYNQMKKEARRGCRRVARRLNWIQNSRLIQTLPHKGCRVTYSWQQLTEIGVFFVALPTSWMRMRRLEEEGQRRHKSGMWGRRRERMTDDDDRLCCFNIPPHWHLDGTHLCTPPSTPLQNVAPALFQISVSELTRSSLLMWQQRRHKCFHLRLILCCL